MSWSDCGVFSSPTPSPVISDDRVEADTSSTCATNQAAADFIYGRRAFLPRPKVDSGGRHCSMQWKWKLNLSSPRSSSDVYLMVQRNYRSAD